ncbi:hypothetical protein BGZ83_003723 [Gryganskiella cystojenkinii]|nr:hypothetical protein BGZ83_003723 [Gryganskiella cystojenkinii]
MEQPSKPAVYLRRLQRALSRPKSSKSKDVATSAAAPPSPSGPPAIITIHHIQPDQHYPSNHSNGTYVTLARSKSMPLRRRKRFSHQPSPSHPFPPTPAMPSYCLVDSPVMTQQQRQPSQWSTCSSVPASPTTLSPPSANHVPELRAESIQDNIMSSGFAAAAAGQPDTTDAVLEQLVLDLDLCPFSKDPGSTVSDTMSDSQSTRQHSLDCNSSSMIVPGDLDGYQNNRTQTPSSPRSPFRVSSRPIRSLTSSSLVSNQSSTTTMTMTQVDSSSMSIQSHMSEASMLSAAMSASGLPSMDMMMDQVDKSIAADRRAQLVENAAVSVPHVTYVNRLSLMAEPCSAKVETWVN